MMAFILLVIIILAIIVIAVFLDILTGWIHFKYFRKCPYCNHRMKYQYKRLDKDGDIECYVFHCFHCGAFENVTPLEMIREEYDTK